MDISKLNPQQQKAVLTTEGPVLVLAGAGSGKTRALTHRIAYLIDDIGVSPYEILALTFTNKAAKEMRDRVEQLIGFMGSRVWVSTFHSCCARILRMDIDKLGYTRDFVIYDDGDQNSLLANIQKKMNISEDDLPKKQLKAVFSDAKNKSLEPVNYISQTRAYKGDKLAEAFNLYQKALKDNNALDFDDLLLKTLELFKREPDVLRRYQDRFHYILVDEYQDTNMAQYELVHLLAAKHGNLCVVGDDDQSIYGWRGADIRNILEFEKDFKDTTVIRLEQNYRSTERILEAANAVIANNEGRKPKRLWTENPTGDRLTLYAAYDGLDEADYVCKTIQRENAAGRPYSDFCILYRTNAQSRPFEEKLTYYGIPFSVYGAVRFYDRKEIKDVIAYMRLVANPSDEVSLRRVLNVPKRGLGNAAVQELETVAAQADMSMLEACKNANILPFSSRTRSKFASFGFSMDKFALLSKKLGVGEFIKLMLDELGFWKYLEEENRKDGKPDGTKQDNVREFINAASEFESQTENEGDSLTAFLENVALVSGADGVEQTSTVSLMTLHTAKGMEYPVVFLAGMEEGLFPTSRAINTAEGIEEERRLCYVGITRAEEKAYLTFARARRQYDSIARNLPSRFLREIPEECVEQEETVQPVYAKFQQKQPLSGVSSYQTDRQQRGRQAFGAFEARPKVTFDSTPVIPASKPVKRNALTFKVGQRVKHAKFGSGLVMTADGGVLLIHFDDCGEKKIVAAYAPLSLEE